MWAKKNTQMICFAVYDPNGKNEPPDQQALRTVADFQSFQAAIFAQETENKYYRFGTSKTLSKIYDQF